MREASKPTPMCMPEEKYEIFQRVEPQEGPYPWMVWAVHAMTNHWFRTRRDAELFIQEYEPRGE